MMNIGIEQIIHFFTNAFGLYIIHYFLEMFLERKREVPKCFMILYFVYYIVISSKYLLDSALIVNVIVNLLFIFAITFSYKNKFQRRILATVLVYSLAMVSEVLAAFLLGVIKEESLTSLFQEESFKLLGNISSKLVYFIIVKIADRIIRKNSEVEIPFLYWLSVFCIPFGSVFILHVIFSLNILYEYNNQNFSLMISVILIIMINFLVFHLYDKLLVETRAKIQNTLLEKQMEYYDKQYEETENMQKEIHLIQHNMKNQLLGIQGCFREKDYVGLENQLVSLLGKIDQTKVLTYSGNAVIDSILYHKISHAKKEEIPVELDLRIPQEIKVNSNNISIILGNALDNAIEACRKLEKNERRISIDMGYEHSALHFVISNPYKGELNRDEHGNLISSKEQKKNHGIGVKSIRRVIEAEDDYMDIDSEDNVFKLKILLFGKNNTNNLADKLQEARC